MISNLPDPIVDEVLQILDGPADARHSAITAMCERYPTHAAEIRRFAAGDGGLGQSTEPGTSSELPSTFGPFRILHFLGRGGMGAVYLAEQKEPVKRRVALKIIRRDLGVNTQAMLTRFEVERAALSRMEHSNIAKVFDAGIHDGQPYFAMEYVKGIPITRYCDNNKLTLEDRLRLFLQVCSGVQHAHNKGVIHRDLTPNNILVTVQDGEPSVRIIDFGLAKGAQGALTDKTVFTQHGAVLGTPAYMSPEQAGLGGLDIDTRSDVYTLGVLLYELLTGGLPFDGKDLQASDDPYRLIREQDPPRPSTRVSTMQGGPEVAARLRRTETRALLDRLRSDLDWIVLKCLEKDRTRRYATPSALGDDIGRHLAHEPVLARAPTFGYRLSKVARKYRGGLFAATAILISLCGGLGLALHFWRQADARSAEIAEQKRIIEASAKALDAKVRDFAVLSVVVRLRALVEEEPGLYPALPERAPAFASWLERARDLLKARTDVERVLASSAHASGGATSAERFLHDELTRLMANLDEFETTLLTGTQREADWIANVARLSCEGRAEQRWQEARAKVSQANDQTASRLYADARVGLKPQLGLVPIGMNPVTKLWEFYHLRSAAPPHALPSHRPDGSIEVTPDTGIVFVLIPGGRFAMGAQQESPDQPNFDPNAKPEEQPVTNIFVEPFFIARHELTQGQWERLARVGDRQPSHYRVGELARDGTTPDGRHPVENMAWGTAQEFLARHSLLLPTEEQWEFAARAYEQAPWHCGPDPRALRSSANLADARFGSLTSDRAEAWDDGWVIHAPVGQFAANRFGLHDVHGNVAEWVLGGGAPNLAHVAEASPALATNEDSETRVVRGGGYANIAPDARTATRKRLARDHSGPNIGIRAACALAR